MSKPQINYTSSTTWATEGAKIQSGFDELYNLTANRWIPPYPIGSAEFTDPASATNNSSSLLAKILTLGSSNPAQPIGVCIEISAGRWLLEFAPSQSDIQAMKDAGINAVLIRGQGSKATQIYYRNTAAAFDLDMSPFNGSSKSVTGLSLATFNSYDVIHKLDVSSSGFSANDRIFIVSQDRPAFDATGRYLGEGFRVKGTDSSSVWVDGRLGWYDRYNTTGLKVFKPDPTFQWAIEGIEFKRLSNSGLDDTTTRISAPAIIMTNCVDAHHKDCVFNDPWYVAVRLESCIDTYGFNPIFKNGKNRPTYNQLTYGHQYYGMCFNCWGFGGKSVGFRHAPFTTDGVGGLSGWFDSGKHLYGQPRFCGWNTHDASETKGACIDTHEEGMDIYALNITARNNHTSDEGTSAGFGSTRFIGAVVQHRCHSLTIRGLDSLDSNSGIVWKVYEQGGGGFLRIEDSTLRRSNRVFDDGHGVSVELGGGTIVNTPTLILNNNTFDDFGYSVNSDIAINIESDGIKSIKPRVGHFNLSGASVAHFINPIMDSRVGTLADPLKGLVSDAGSKVSIINGTHILPDDLAKMPYFISPKTQFSPAWISKATTATVIFGVSKKTVSSVTLSGTSPVVVTTTTAHGYSTGNEVVHSEIGGSVELNGVRYTITVTSSTSYSLDGTNSSLFSAYTASGRVLRTTAHGLSVGDKIALENINGMTQISNTTATVAAITDTTAFTINVNTTSYSTFNTGGLVTPLPTKTITIKNLNEIDDYSVGSQTIINPLHTTNLTLTQSPNFKDLKDIVFGTPTATNVYSLRYNADGTVTLVPASAAAQDGSGLTAFSLDTLTSPTNAVKIKQATVTTTNSTATKMAGVVVPEGAMIQLEAMVSGITSTGGEAVLVKVCAGARRVSGGNVTLIGTTASLYSKEDSSGSPSATITVNTSTQEIEINAVGESAKTYTWRTAYTYFINTI